MSKAKNLYCSCGFQTDLILQYVCNNCLGPLSVGYDFSSFDSKEFLADLANRETSIWRYKEFLPPRETANSILRPSPLFRSHGLEKYWGIKEVWIKDDSALPTHSFKDRVVEVALQSALRFGLREVGCASTGNLAGAVASASARLGLPAKIFVPDSIEPEKIKAASVYGGKIKALPLDYDGVNLHCSLLVEDTDIGIVNVNLRPYYAEGSKTILFETAEALNWRLPEHIVSPTASGSLLSKVWQAAGELQKAGIGDFSPVIHGGQDEGCAPIARAFREKLDFIRPEKAGKVLAHSLAIGNPGSGDEALLAVKKSGGRIESVSAQEISVAIALLAKKAGVWTESAGGVTVATANRLAEGGMIARDSSLLLLITGDGLKTPEAINVK
jgi:threonine synthase